jgi:hypothetical protein
MPLGNSISGREKRNIMAYLLLTDPRGKLSHLGVNAMLPYRVTHHQIKSTALQRRWLGCIRIRLYFRNLEISNSGSLGSMLRQDVTTQSVMVRIIFFSAEDCAVKWVGGQAIISEAAQPSRTPVNEDSARSYFDTCQTKRTKKERKARPAEKKAT